MPDKPAIPALDGLVDSGEKCKSTFEQGYQKCSDDPSFCCTAADAVDQVCFGVTYLSKNGNGMVQGWEDFSPWAKAQLAKIQESSACMSDGETRANCHIEHLEANELCIADNTTCCDGLQRVENACVGTAFIADGANGTTMNMPYRYADVVKEVFETRSNVTCTPSVPAWTCDHEHEDAASCTDSGSTWTHGDNDGQPGCGDCWCCKPTDAT